MEVGLSEILVGALALALLVAALWDLKSRIIPNWLNALIALGAIPFWWATGLDFWPDAALQIAIAAGVFGLFYIAFHFGGMGGGDLKMIAAIALWLPYQALIMLLVIMSIAGGVLTLVMLVRHRMAKQEQQPEIPYGVAIAFAGLWLISERFLYQFG